MSQQSTPAERTHRVHRFTGRLHQVLDDLGRPSPWVLDDTEVTTTLVEVTTGIARLQALQLDLLAHVDKGDLPQRTGAVNTAGWLRGHTEPPRVQWRVCSAICRVADGSLVR
jgi:hypothetical protein